MDNQSYFHPHLGLQLTPGLCLYLNIFTYWHELYAIYIYIYIAFSLGIVESAILELSGSVAPEFATAVFGGQGVSGFFNCIVRITIELSISSSSSSNHSLAIILYFVVVIILMVIFYCLYEVLMRKIPQDTPANSPETSLTNQSTDKRMLPAGRKQSDDVYIPVEPQSPPSSKIRRSQTPRYQKKAFFGVIPDEKAKVQNIFEEQVSIREAEEPSINKEMITEEKVQVQELCTSLDFGDLAAKHFDLCKTPDQHVKKEVKTIKSTTDSFMSSNILTSIPNTSPRSKRRKTLRKRHSLSPDQRRGSSPIKISKFLRRAETVTTDPLSPLSSDRERTIIPTLVPPTIQDLENLTFKDKRKLIWLIIKKTKGILIGIFILMASHYLIFPGYMIKMNVEGVEDCKWNTIIIVSVFSTFDTICRLSASKCSCIKPQAFWAPLIVRCAFTLVIVIVPIVQKGDELLSSVYTVVILVAGATIVLAISLSISFVFIYQTVLLYIIILLYYYILYIIILYRSRSNYTH